MDIVFIDDSWKTLTNAPFVAGDYVSTVKPELLKQEYRNRHSVQLGVMNFKVPLWSYVNHSCDPTCKILETEFGYSLVALKCMDIGDEITFDYTKNENRISESFDCNCGALNCYGEINKQ